MAVRLRAVCEALQAAFTEDEFERVLLDLGIALDDIAKPGTWAQRTFELVTWAARNGRMVELVQAAQAANPGNEALAALNVQDTGRANRERAARVETATHMSDLQPIGGNGEQRRLGEQIGKLSSDVAHLQEDFRGMKDDLAAIRAMLQRRSVDTWGNQSWWVAALVLVGLATLGVTVALRLP